MLSEKIRFGYAKAGGEIVSVANSEPGFYNTKISKQTHFLLCGTCLWCASYLRRNYGSTISKCPACNEDRLESIPISDNDVYRFDYEPKRGIILEFSKLEKYKE